jgi:SPP1 gp7 family putative phage head morphogenesis protein
MQEQKKNRKQPTGNGLTRSLEVSNYLHTTTCQCEACQKNAEWVGILISNSVNLDVLLQQGLKRLYDRKIAEGSNDAAFVKYNQEQLWDAVKSGWQGKPENLKFGSPQHELLLNLRNNTQVFAIFKTHDMCKEVHAELFDANGNQRTFKEFQKAVKPILKDYNQNWLQAEWQTAEASARMAQKWKSFEEKFSSNAMLTYKTIGDARVRDEHALLEGMTKKITDPVWNVYYPPNGYRCRCYIRASATEPVSDPEGFPDVPKLFRVNVGKTMTALPPDHPYYQVDPSFIGRILKSFNVFSTALNREQISRNFALFEKYTLDPEIDVLESNIFKESGGFVGIHKKSDTDLKSRIENESAAKRLAKLRGDVVLLNEHVNINKVSNPEYTINGTITSDLKTCRKGTSRNIVNCFDDARDKQDLTHVVINADLLPGTDEIIKGLKMAFGFHKNIETAVVLYKNQWFEVTKQMAKEKRIAEYINKKALDQ